MVTCLENPSVNYDVYLPPAYSTNGPPLPILYTLSPGGGGMVTSFQAACSQLNIILVGLKSSETGLPWYYVLRDFYAVPRDIRRRVLFDPTAVFVGGFSGGGENSYVFSRFWSQHVSGVLGLDGWLGRENTSASSVAYFSTDRVQTNLLVARTCGTTDTAGLFYNIYDSNYLASCGAVVQDWYFTGGHAIAPTSVMKSCLQWLVSQRIPAGPGDQTNSAVRAADWRSRMAAGQSEAVLRECVATLMNQPRTWFALQAQLVLDDLMTNYNAFQTLDVSNLYPASSAVTTDIYSVTSGDYYDANNQVFIYNFAGVNYWSQSDFASDLFYYYARGAAANHDWQRYDCCLKALTGITGTTGDRAGDNFDMLTNYNYPAPLLQMSASPSSGQANLWLSEVAPGITYSLQSWTDLADDFWQGIPTVDLDTNTVWLTTTGFDPAAECNFYRVGTVPTPGTSPPWMQN